MGGYSSGTNELKKLRKLEKLCRKALGQMRYRSEPLTTFALVLHCQQWRGSAGHYSITNSVLRDMLKTCDELTELRTDNQSGTGSAKP